MPLYNYVITTAITSLVWFGLYMHRLMAHFSSLDKLEQKLSTSQRAYYSLLSQFNILKTMIGDRQHYSSPSSPPYSSHSQPTLPTPLDLAYKLLGLTRMASAQEIKNKFRMLVKKYHPDHNKNKSAPAKFRAVNDAYKLITSTK
jgi:DnaJ-domain-containing protein 1